MSEENKALMRRWIEEGHNKRNLTVADEVCDPAFVWRLAPVGEIRGPEALKEMVKSIHTAFPNWQVTVEEQIAEGDMVATRKRATGTHQGEFMGIAPTGKQVTTSTISISRIAGGKIVEGWEVWDAHGMLQQLGATPASTANKVPLRRYIEELVNKHDISVADEILAEDVVERSPYMADLRGIAAIKQFQTRLFTAFPDVHLTTDALIAEGGTAVARFTFSGTHQGEYAGIAPTGKRITFPGTMVTQVSGGKITDFWVIWDELSAQQQFGVLPQPTEANKALARRFFDNFLNKREWALADELFADNFVYRAPHLPELRGPEAMKQLFTGFQASFPDYRYDVEELIAEADEAVVRWTCTGTHKGEWMGIAPAGKPISVSGTTTLRISGGKIVEHWADYDTLGFYQQVGAAPQAAANKALARRFLDDFLNKRNWAVTSEIFADDFVLHMPQLPELRSSEAMKQLHIGVQASFPDVQFTMEEPIAEGDKVVIRWTGAGTHKGEWMGVAPTGKFIRWGGIAILRVSGGKIAEEWAEWDGLSYFQQLGVVPPLGRAEDKAAA